VEGRRDVTTVLDLLVGNIERRAHDAKEEPGDSNIV
jgi:hypothetical protein